MQPELGDELAAGQAARAEAREESKFDGREQDLGAPEPKGRSENGCDVGRRSHPHESIATCRLDSDDVRWLFLLAYTCSGLAGLIYEVSWTRLLTLYIGHTTAAASAVVAAFLGGLAAGAWAGGVLASRWPRRTALKAYVGLELGVAVVALGLPWALDAHHAAARLGVSRRRRRMALSDRAARRRAWR